MRKLLAAVLLYAVPLSLAAAQSSQPWYVGKPIKNITFSGLVHVTPNDLQGIVDQYIGKDFTDSLFWDLQSKLYALDYFQSFTPNAEAGDPEKTSVIINFQVVERPIVSEIKIIGNSHIRTSDILNVVTLKKDSIINKTKLRNDSDAIVNLYQEKGYPDAKVNASIDENDAAKTAVVTFTVNEGNQTKVSKLLFEGNHFASDSTLRRLLKTKTASLFNSGIYQESNLAQDKQNIIDYYQNHGFEDVQVPDITKSTEPEKGTTNTLLTLTYHIKEGPQYTYGGTTFHGNTLFTTQQLSAQIPLQTGDILDKSKLNLGFGRIHDLYLNDGYIFNTFDTQEHKDTQTNVISYTMNITELGRAHVEDIIIKGNKKTKDFVIRREIPIQVGDVFSKEKVIEGLRNLYNTQFFSSVTPETQVGSVPGLMDLIFNVEEAKTTNINFGLSVSGAQTGFPILGFVQLADQNFLGLGQQISIGSQVSQTLQSVTLGWANKWTFGRRWSNSLNLSFQHVLQQDQPQDILPPIFGNQSYAVPDPYTGQYVFSQNTTYGGTQYSAGQPFPGTATASDISTYNLITDYTYAQSQGQSIPAAYLMSYDEYDLSLAWSTGYSWHTRYGIFSAGTGLNETLSYIHYDSSKYRPFNPTVRQNLDTWLPITQVPLQFSWDTRDIAYDPSNGFYVKQAFLYTGGILPSSRQYIESTSRFDFYKTLFSIPVTENWSFKTVFDVRTQLSLVFPQFGQSQPIATTSDLLYIDGISIARGWDRRTNGAALWDNWIELRIPIVQQYLWWNFYLSGTVMYPQTSQIEHMKLSDFLFSTGGGFQLAIPGLPIGLYLALPFQDLNGQLYSPPGNTGLGGLSLVISFNTSVY